jgi:hypothetical protein
VIPELDGGLKSRLSRLVETGEIRNARCFRLTAAGVEERTSAFREDPLSFCSPAPVRFREIPEVRLEVSPPIIRRGVDTLRLRIVNMDTRAVDLLCTIDGQLMPPVLQWRLDSKMEASVFVDMTTPAGEYQFQAIRPSGEGDSAWIKVSAHAVVR